MVETARLAVEKLSNLLGKGFKAFLEPGHPACSCCGSMPRYSGLNPLGVCSSCFKQIPWIRDTVCPVCGRYEECPDCQRGEERTLLMNRSAVAYDDRMRELLALYKYRGDERLQVMMGKMLVHAYRLYPVGHKFDLLTFVPLSEDRLKERGFNQAEQMARVLGSEVNLPVVRLLQRTRITDKQSFKSRRERMDDLKGVFAANQAMAQRIGQRYARRVVRIAIVDDVYTTGSTLNQCAVAIRNELPDARVYGVCWAR